MNRVSTVFAAGVIVLVALPLLRRVVARLARALVRRSVTRVASRVVQRMPDAVTVVPDDGTTWVHRAFLDATLGDLTAAGFRDAGTFRVAEFGVLVRFAVHPSRQVYAALYEHPKSGDWFDLVTLCDDGTNLTVATNRATGLRHMPGHEVIHLPGASVTDALAQWEIVRDGRPARSVTETTVASEFSAACTKQLAWRRQAGVHPDEVLRVWKQRGRDGSKPGGTPPPARGGL